MTDALDAAEKRAQDVERLRERAHEAHELCCGGHAESEGDDRPCKATEVAIDALADAAGRGR